MPPGGSARTGAAVTVTGAFEFPPPRSSAVPDLRFRLLVSKARSSYLNGSGASTPGPYAERRRSVMKLSALARATEVRSVSEC